MTTDLELLISSHFYHTRDPLQNALLHKMTKYHATDKGINFRKDGRLKSWKNL